MSHEGVREEDDGACSPCSGDDGEEDEGPGGMEGPESTVAACVAAAGTVSARPATTSVLDGSVAAICEMISARPVPVSSTSRTSCQAVCHVTSLPSLSRGRP